MGVGLAGREGGVGWLVLRRVGCSGRWLLWLGRILLVCNIKGGRDGGNIVGTIGDCGVDICSDGVDIGVGGVGGGSNNCIDAVR